MSSQPQRGVEVVVVDDPLEHDSMPLLGRSRAHTPSRRSSPSPLTLPPDSEVKRAAVVPSLPSTTPSDASAFGSPVFPASPSLRLGGGGKGGKKGKDGKGKAKGAKGKDKKDKKKDKKKDGGPTVPLRTVAGVLFSGPGRREGVRLIVGAVFLAVYAVCQLSVPRYFGAVIDSVMTVSHSDGSHPQPTSQADAVLHSVQKDVLAIVLITMIGAVAGFAYGYLFSQAGEQLVYQARSRLFRSLLRQDVAFFDEARTGELLSRISSDANVLKNAVTSNAATILKSSITAFGGAIHLLVLSWKMALIVLIIMPVTSGGIRLYGRYVKQLSKSARKALAAATTVAEESFSNIRTVKSFVQEDRMADRFDDEASATLNMGLKIAVSTGLLNGAVEGVTTLCLASILYLGVLEVLYGDFTSGSLASFLIYSIVVRDAVSSLAAVSTRLVKARGSTERMFQLMMQVPSIPGGGEGIVAPFRPQRIDFNDVHFAYPTRPDIPVLRGVNLTLLPGSVTAVVGPSGHGKSTIVKLLQRFYDPDAGEILVDGRPLPSLDTAWFRESVAVVSQDPSLFCLPISDNIAFGAPAVSERSLYNASVAANAHQFVSEFPEGYDTVVGEKGLRVSGGQRQRIAIARALCMNPSILLLDEATSAMDAASEHLVQQALDRVMVGRTVLVVAHRLSTVKCADQVVFLSNGQVAGVGSHEELLLSSPEYQALVSRQLVSQIHGASYNSGDDGGVGGGGAAAATAAAAAGVASSLDVAIDVADPDTVALDATVQASLAAPHP